MRFTQSVEFLGSYQSARAGLQSITHRIFRTALLSAAALLCTAGTTSAQTVTTLYSFQGNLLSGANPWYVTLAQGTNGNLYGTTYNGGVSSLGTIFSVNTSGAQKIVHSFKSGSADGANPTGGLTLGSNNNFYGTTQQGGAQSQGVIFQVTQTGTFSILHTFNAFVDGAFPWGPPILATDGNLYGTASGGGLNGRGIVYKITTTGTFSVVYKFDVTHGYSPVAPPTQGTDGFLYIPVSQGGASFCGTIIQLSTSGILNNSYSFPCGSGGSFPIGPLVQAANGNFYSTTQDGGANGEGVIYQVTTGLAVTVLHSFGVNFGDGTFPSAGLILGTDGNYYGATADGGGNGDGTLFNTSTSGSYSGLYSFNNSANLSQTDPLSPPIQYTDGNFYGLTEFSGTSNDGTFYSLNMGLAPFVNTALFAAKRGENITILGTNLKGTTQVTFNGEAAAFKVLSDSNLIAMVPASATTGPIEVRTQGGVLQGRKNFVVKP